MAYPTDDLPFFLDLKSIHGHDSVKCEQLLRDLPGKRKVFRGFWQQRAVVVKLFLDPNTARRHWGREKTGVEALKAASVSTPELVFSGKLEDGTPALMFDLLPEAQTALQVWESLTTKDQRADFLQQLVELVAGLHNAGLVQEDLHLENFLVSGGKIYAIDGDAVTDRGQGAALADAVSSRNLALLFAQLPPKFDCLIEGATQRYAELRRVHTAGLLASLSTDLPDVRRRRRHKYVDKCYRSCSEFERLELFGKITVSRRDQAGTNLSQLLEDPDAFMARGTLLKDGNSSTVVRVRGDHCDWVVKRYNIKSFWHWLSHCLRNTRAWISWGNAHRLKISGIATPQAIAMIEKRFGPLRSTGYYVSEFVAGPHAEAFFRDDTLPDKERQQAARSFVELFELLRKLGIRHGDCKATNFLLRDLVPWILDLDAMSECHSGARSERLFRSDRERFLRNWQEQPELQQWFDEHLPQ
jgi:tRNA A-37 threonylcarbamoyl transferase component Bud32